jgi:hypothetical protein
MEPRALLNVVLSTSRSRALHAAYLNHFLQKYKFRLLGQIKNRQSSEAVILLSFLWSARVLLTCSRRTKMAYADEMEVTDEWFKSHRLPREDRPLEVHMMRFWKRHMSREDSYGTGWSTRLAAHLADVPRTGTIRDGRVATTFAWWVMTPVGGEFLQRVFQSVKPKTPTTSFDSGRVSELWGREARYDPMFNNIVDHLLRGDDNKWVYSDPPYPTLEDYRVMEHTLLFFLSDEGRVLLKKVYRAAKEKYPF